MSDRMRGPQRNPNPQSQPGDGAPEAGIQAVGDANTRTEPTNRKPDPETIFPLIVGWYRTSRDHWQEMRQEMAEAFDLRAGHQWADEDLQVLADQMRPAITFNMTDKFIDGVGGLEINNRLETVFVPRQVGATGVTDLLTSAGQWVRQECDAEDEETEMFLDAVTGGWGWCLSGDAMVRLPNSHMMTSRLYSGNVITIDLENGQSLTGTPNHPVLTNVGWKGLHELKEGDYLVNSNFLKRIRGFPDDQFDHVEARLEDKINAFRAGREVCCFPTASDDFNSDGIGSHVHIVYADRTLKNEIVKTAHLQLIKKHFFAWHDSLAARCLDLFRYRLLPYAVNITEHQFAFSAIQAPQSHIGGGLFFSKMAPRNTKTSAHILTGCADLRSDLFCRQLFLEIEAFQLFCRNLRLRASPSSLSQDVTSGDKPVLNDTHGYSNFIRDFRDWKPLLEIEAREFFGANCIASEFVTRVKGRVVRPVENFVVHDVATSIGMFIAGDVITSNTQTRMDYDDEPDGMGVIERIDPLEMFPDANARKQNLTDRRHHLRVKDIPIGAAEEMFPDVDPLLLHAQWAEDQPDATRSPHNARLAPYYRIDQSADVDRNEQLVRMVEVEWWEYAEAWRVLDPASGKYVRLDKEKAALYALRCRAVGVNPSMIKDRQKKYWKAIVGAEVLKIMHGPKRGGFQYKCMTGKRDQNKGTWYGIVRAMRDPQLWLNKWVSQGLHVFNTNAKGGMIIETDAVADVDEFRDAWAEADSVIELNPGGLSKIQQKEPAQFPQQLNQMTEMAMGAFPQVTGIPVELMGQSGSQAPQVALMEVGRRQAGMNVLAWAFNAKRRYHKEQGRLLLWMIQEYIADGRLIRIGGPEQKQYVPLIHEPGLAEYDVIVDDAPTSTNMKDKVWAALMQLFPMLRGIPDVPPAFYIDALKYSPVPASAVSDWQKMLAQKPPPNPEQQAKIAVTQAQATEIQGRAALHQAEVQHMGAETARVGTVTQLMPAETNLKVLKQQADIEKTRADAANALQNAGISADDQRFRQTMAAVDALLRVHGAALDHVQGQHERAMDVAGLANQSAPQTQGAAT